MKIRIEADVLGQGFLVDADRVPARSFLGGLDDSGSTISIFPERSQEVGERCPKVNPGNYTLDRHHVFREISGICLDRGFSAP